MSGDMKDGPAEAMIAAALAQMGKTKDEFAPKKTPINTPEPQSNGAPIKASPKAPTVPDSLAPVPSTASTPQAVDAPKLPTPKSPPPKLSAAKPAQLFDDAKPSVQPNPKEQPVSTTPNIPKKPTPHYHGHRDRLRGRFKDSGVGALADYELLEMYLFRSIPRKDTKPMAKDLIAKFGSFAEVIAAPLHRLAEVKGISENIALDLKILQAGATKLSQESVLGRPVLSSWTALLDYCRSAMQFEPVEQFRVLFLDRKNRLIADEVMGRGTVDRAPVYPREIIKRALALEATALILAHNHPSGDPTPSQSDIDMTKHIVNASKAIDVTVHDHLIIGRDNIASFKTLGLM